MVVKVRQTDKKAFDHTIASLRNVGAPISGIVLNAITHKNSYGAIITITSIIIITGVKRKLKNYN